jgi:sugar O-acyltransferase (sialic acid O-acetyltransferase NeuD family)
MKTFGIFGTSGMAREAGDIACELGYSPIYIARDQSELDAWAFPAEAILEADVLRYRGTPFVIGIGENAARQRLAQRHAGEIHFSNLIHPSATFGQGQRKAIEERQGIIVCAGVRFTNNIQLGNFCIFNQNATIAHDVVIEDFVHIAPGSIISGNVHIGLRSWIGAGAVVNQGAGNAKIHIGADAVIGSGAVVVKPCEAKAIYVGVPAKRIK